MVVSGSSDKTTREILNGFFHFTPLDQKTAFSIKKEIVVTEPQASQISKYDMR